MAELTTFDEFHVLAPRIPDRDMYNCCLYLNIPREHKILDVGCGSGAFVDMMSELGFNITGIDIGEQSVKLSTSGRCSVGDVLTHEGKYDVITDCCSLCMISEEAFVKARALLNDNGILITRFFLAKPPVFKGDEAVLMRDGFLESLFSQFMCYAEIKREYPHGLIHEVILVCKV